MTTLKILRYTCVLLLSSWALPALAQVQQPDSVARPKVRGIQYSSSEAAALEKQKAVPFLSGMSVSADLAGGVMAAVAPYGQLEGAFRVHLYEKFFPVVEVGWGLSDHTDEVTAIHYKTGAPYFRIGCDYNFMKNRRSGNRIFGGLRFAFTSFEYDVDAPPVTDPIYGTQLPFSYHGLGSNSQWVEAVFGLEAKIWKFINLGWTFRYKIQMHVKNTEVGNVWYIPGYGKSDGSALGGTFNLIFNI